MTRSTIDLNDGQTLFIVKYMDSDSNLPDELYVGCDIIKAKQTVKEVVEGWGDVSDIKAHSLGEVEIGELDALLADPFRHNTVRVWTDAYSGYVPAIQACPGKACIRFGSDKCQSCIRDDSDKFDWCDVPASEERRD